MVPLQDIGDYTDAGTGAGIYHRDRVGSVMYSPTGKVLEINQKKESTLKSGMEYLFGTEAVRRDGTVYRKGGAIFKCYYFKSRRPYKRSTRKIPTI